MRKQLFGLALAGLLGLAGVVSAQAPGTLPMVKIPPSPAVLVNTPQATPAVPVAPAPVPAAPAPVVVQGQGCSSGCSGVPSCLPPVKDGCGKDGGKGGLFGKLFIGSGVANPVSCGTWGTERSFLFGSCSGFYTPGRTCNGEKIQYGPGGLGNAEPCKSIGTYLNR